MRSLRSILVLGAGELGLPMLQALSAYIKSNSPATKLSVLTRPSSLSNPSPSQQETQKTIRSLDVILAPGDITGPAAELVSIFRDYDAIISCTGMTAGSGTQLKIAQAVLEAGVGFFIPWQFGVDYDLIGRGSAQKIFDEQLEVRALLRAQSKTTWVIVSTGVFLSFVFWEGWGLVEGVMGASTADPTVRGLGSWDNKLSVTSVEDIGRLTAEVVFDDTVKSGVVFTAGETFEYRGLADTVERVTGKKVKRELQDVESLTKALEKDPGNGLLMYKKVFGDGVGVAWDDSQTYNHQKGIETEGVEAWLKRSLAT
jgi:hypothetical protein